MDLGLPKYFVDALFNFELGSVDTLTLVQVIFWFAAGVISFYFSIGNARVWTSISLGFFLIFLSQAYTLNPWTMYNKVAALHTIIGTLAILLISHGFLEYYVFSRTLEIAGSKGVVYLTTVLLVAASAAFLLINPQPTPSILRNLRIIENAMWVFLALINLEIIRKVYLALRDTAIAKGFVAFGIVFVCIFLWKGAELYLQVFQWDREWLDIIQFTGEASDVASFPGRVGLSRTVHQIFGYLSGLSVGGAFLYLYRLLK